MGHALQSPLLAFSLASFDELESNLDTTLPTLVQYHLIFLKHLSMIVFLTLQSTLI